LKEDEFRQQIGTGKSPVLEAWQTVRSTDPNMPHTMEENADKLKQELKQLQNHPNEEMTNKQKDEILETADSAIPETVQMLKRYMKDRKPEEINEEAADGTKILKEKNH